jgi:hypothetical protein
MGKEAHLALFGSMALVKSCTSLSKTCQQTKPAKYPHACIGGDHYHKYQPQANPPQ